MQIGPQEETFKVMEPDVIGMVVEALQNHVANRLESWLYEQKDKSPFGDIDKEEGEIGRLPFSYKAAGNLIQMDFEWFVKDMLWQPVIGDADASVKLTVA